MFQIKAWSQNSKLHKFAYGANKVPDEVGGSIGVDNKSALPPQHKYWNVSALYEQVYPDGQASPLPPIGHSVGLTEPGLKCGSKSSGHPYISKMLIKHDKVWL